jgi:hypothetical protein
MSATFLIIQPYIWCWALQLVTSWHQQATTISNMTKTAQLYLLVCGGQ